MNISALLALLVLPGLVSSQTVLFHADAETGDLSEWTANEGGSCEQSVPEGPSTMCVATSEQAHSGCQSFKLHLPNPSTNNGLKLARWDYGTDPTKGMQQGQTYYFSSWYYIAAGYTGTAGQWTNNIQWKTNGGGFDPTIVIGFRPLNGVLQVAVDHWACQQGAVPCLTFAGLNSSRGFYTQMTPRPVPRNQWFHLETRYTAARSNGRITVWQDGVQILDMSGAQFNTWDSLTTMHTSLQFYVSNFLDPSITGDQLLYVDDIMITEGASPVFSACPLGQDFWKRHRDAWPVTCLTLGFQTYSQAALLNILNTPVRGDASVLLARQLIGTKLNLAHGSDPAPVSATITEADSLLSQFADKLPYKVAPSSATGQRMVSDANVFDSYNKGNLTPDCQP